MATQERTSAAPAGGSFLIERHPAGELLTPERFPDDLRMIGQTAERFVQREIRPVFEELEALSYELSVEKMRRAGEMGLLGIDVPEEYGGLDGSKAASMLVAERLAGAGSFNVTFNAHTCIGTLPLVYFGTPDQREKYLPKLASGEWIAAYCLTEPGSGSDSRSAKTRAILDDAGTHYVLDGTKMWISNAGFADLFIVFAQEGGERFTAFLVERDTPGLSFGAEEHKMGIKGSSTRQVILEGARVPRENVLGEIGKGHHIAFGVLNVGRLKLAAGAVGGLKEALRLAAGYALEREQFGSPIAKFGLIREKLGWMTARAYAVESAVYRVTGDADRNLVGRDTPAARLEALDEYVIEYSILKVAASEALDEVLDEALQIFGGNGFSAEYPIELAYRNSRINRIFEGTNEINRLLATGQLLKRALKGRLDLMAAAQLAVRGDAVSDVDAPDATRDAVLALENAKRATLLVAGLAAMTYAQALEAEQEVMARAADMLTAVYLAESALLRAEALVGSAKGDTAALLARITTFDAVDRMRALGAEALRRIPGGRDALPKLHAYLPEHGVDLIELRRQASDRTLEDARYPLA